MATALQYAPRPPVPTPGSIAIALCSVAFAVVYLGSSNLVMSFDSKAISVLTELSNIWYLHVILALVNTLFCSALLHLANSSRFTRFQGALLPLPMFIAFAITDYPYQEKEYLPVMLLTMLIVSSTSSVTAVLCFRR